MTRRGAMSPIYAYSPVQTMRERALARIRCVQYGVQLWAACVARKSRPCEVCGFTIARGESALAPMTNGYNRMHRICGTCIRIMSTRLGVVDEP